MAGTKLTQVLKAHGIIVRGTTEEFNGMTGGFWVSAETCTGDQKHLDYWNDSFVFGVSQSLNSALEKIGYFVEFYDPGTAFVFKN